MPKVQKSNLTVREKSILSNRYKAQQAPAYNGKTSSHIDSIEALYQALKGEDKTKTHALLLLLLRNWLTQVSIFDPLSGLALPIGIDDFLTSLAKWEQDDLVNGELKDLVYRLVAHTKESLVAIMRQMRTKILREHLMLPINAAREVDSKSVQWLSRQPGRNLREKLSGKPYIKAVKRKTSVDTAENRLVKAFLLRLEQILLARQEALTTTTEKTCEEMLVSIQSWLREEDIIETGAWRNLAPNNSLLEDKSYRKVWDAWLWLQALDEQIKEDNKRVNKDLLKLVYWNSLALLNASGRFRTFQQPLEVDYNNFSIVPQFPLHGFLLPDFSAKIKGKVKFINPDKSFGFITADKGKDFYFNSKNLTPKLAINALALGTEVFFVGRKNQQGEFADDIHLATKIIPIAFNLMDDKWELKVGDDKYLLKILATDLVIEQPDGKQKRIKIEPATLNKLANKILSLTIDSTFDSFVPANEQKEPITMATSVVNLCSIRPSFTDNKGASAQLPFRLMQQIWTLKDGSKYALDCGSARGIFLDKKIETISMKSLFSQSSKVIDGNKNSASMFFAQKLSNYIKADKLTYIIPDWGNDFELESIRKSMNFYFTQSNPLPKSIATIFAWQASKKFMQDKVGNNDLVLVVDSFEGGISITPVQAIYRQELHKILPKTQGISWERHPTIMEPNKAIQSQLIKNLSETDCKIAPDLLQLFGFDGLSADAGNISFATKGNFYHLPNSIGAQLSKNLNSKLLSQKLVHQCLSSITKNKPKNIFILPLENTIKKPDTQVARWLGSVWSPIKGCQNLNKWQEEKTKAKEKIDEIALWRDHLPKLSIRIINAGKYENLYLVENATVTPQLGKAVKIPVTEHFTLPAGQTHYAFPLQQGEGNKELEFVAYLKSPAFPLKTDISCKLEMTYTYGADDPYELKFIPLDSTKAAFKSIKVEWRPAVEREAVNLDGLAVPDFPARKSWSDFTNFSQAGRKSTDLFDWLEREMQKIADIARYGRVSGKIEKWVKNEYCFIDDTLIHKSRLKSNKEQNLPSPGNSLSFYKIMGENGKFSAEDVTIGKEQPDAYFLSKSLRFPTLTIWNYGNSLTDIDVPDHFRNRIFEGIQDIIEIIKSKNMPESLKEELFFFLCCLHKDAPQEVVASRLISAVKDTNKLREYKRHIAFSIGNAELSYQQELLKNILKPMNNKALTQSIVQEILSIALWRSKEMIDKLTKDQIETLSKNLYISLDYDLKMLKELKNKKNYQQILARHLELLLALLRSRGSDGEEFKSILAPNKELTKKYVDLLDNLVSTLGKNKIKLKSRISLQIEKPKELQNTPDLLYALQMYLTGNSGANTISVTNIKEED